MKEKQEMCGRRDERVEKDKNLLWLDKNNNKEREINKVHKSSSPNIETISLFLYSGGSPAHPGIHVGPPLFVSSIESSS